MTNLKLWVRIVLFTSSFSPLAIIWGLNFRNITFLLYKWNISILWPIILIILFSVALLILCLEKNRRNNNPQRIKVVSSENLNNSHIEYLLTYVFAFLPLGNYSFIAFLIFMIVLLVVYLKSNLLYVNPVLTLLGYNIFKIKDNKDNAYILITRKGAFINNEFLNASIFSKDILVETIR